MDCSQLTEAFDRLDAETDAMVAMGLRDRIVGCGSPALTAALARIAKPSAPDRSIKNAIPVVAELGGDEEGQVVLRLLAHASAGIRETAAVALLNHFSPGFGSTEIAAQLSKEPRLATRVVLVQALARSRDAKWKDVYTELAVTTDPDELNRSTAYGKLGAAIERAVARAESSPR